MTAGFTSTTAMAVSVTTELWPCSPPVKKNTLSSATLIATLRNYHHNQPSNNLQQSESHDQLLLFPFPGLSSEPIRFVRSMGLETYGRQRENISV